MNCEQQGFYAKYNLIIIQKQLAIGEVKSWCF